MFSWKQFQLDYLDVKIRAEICNNRASEIIGYPYKHGRFCSINDLGAIYSFDEHQRHGSTWHREYLIPHVWLECSQDPHTLDWLIHQEKDLLEAKTHEFAAKNQYEEELKWSG